MENVITVKNMSSGMLTLVAPNFHFRRSLNPGQEAPVPRDVFDELSFDPGFQTLARSGYFKIKGLEEMDSGIVETPAEDTMADVVSIKKMLTEHDLTKFKKFIAKASPVAKETIVQQAVALNITDPSFTALIKKHCGVDVINAITTERQANEPAKE